MAEQQVKSIVECYKYKLINIVCSGSDAQKVKKITVNMFKLVSLSPGSDAATSADAAAADPTPVC